MKKRELTQIYFKIKIITGIIPEIKRIYAFYIISMDLHEFIQLSYAKTCMEIYNF